jgi:hypothetical protein
MGFFGFGKKKEQEAQLVGPRSELNNLPELDLPPLPPANLQDQSLNFPDLPDMNDQATEPSQENLETTEIPSLDNLDLDFDLSLPEDQTEEATQEEIKKEVAREEIVKEELPPIGEFVGEKFLKVDKFKEMIKITGISKNEIEECIMVGSGVGEVHIHQMKALEKFQNEVMSLYKKISNIDKAIFER